MADVGHLAFSKFRVYVKWPLLPCYSASLCKSSLKSSNRLLSYDQKRFLIWRPSAILNIKKYLATWLSSSSKCAVVYQISFKNRWYFRWDGDFTIFKMADLRHLEFRDPIMGSLKSPCGTSYRSSIETIALNCLLFEKIAFFLLATDRQTNEQKQCVRRSRCREQRFNEQVYRKPPLVKAQAAFKQIKK